MKSESRKVAVLGDVNIDIFLNIPTYPPPGGDAMADQMELHTGGSAANTAILLSRLGFQTEMLTHTGDDPWADIAFRTLRAERVGLDHLSRDGMAGTGLIFLPVTPNGERTMFSYHGANALLSPAEITPPLFDEVALLHISGYALLQSPQKEAAWCALELAQARGIPVTLDLGVEPAAVLGQDIERLLGRLDLLVLGPQEALLLAKQPELEPALETLLACGVKTIGLKLGLEGCLLVTTGKRARLPGFPVETIDTTGAGDAFSAALIYGRLNSLSLEARGLLANAFGAVATTVWGGGAAFPGLDAVKNLLSRPGDALQPFKPWLAEALAALD